MSINSETFEQLSEENKKKVIEERKKCKLMELLIFDDKDLNKFIQIAYDCMIADGLFPPANSDDLNCDDNEITGDFMNLMIDPLFDDLVTKKYFLLFALYFCPTFISVFCPSDPEDNRPYLVDPEKMVNFLAVPNAEFFYLIGNVLSGNIDIRTFVAKSAAIWSLMDPWENMDHYSKINSRTKSVEHKILEGKQLKIKSNTLEMKYYTKKNMTSEDIIFNLEHMTSKKSSNKQYLLTDAKKNIETQMAAAAAKTISKPKTRLTIKDSSSINKK